MERACAVCFAPLTGRQTVVCSARCRVKRQNTSDAYRSAKKRYRARGGEVYPVTCDHCGTEAMVTKREAKFCSQACAKAGLATLARPRWHEAKRRLARAERGRRRGHPLYVSSDGEVSIRCPWGRSDSHRSDWISRADRQSIYERDGWVCQLCSDPVDPELDPNDIWAATLDHIVCRSWTGEPDDSPENLRLAHRWCNSVRSDETHYSGEVLAA